MFLSMCPASPYLPLHSLVNHTYGKFNLFRATSQTIDLVFFCCCCVDWTQHGALSCKLFVWIDEFWLIIKWNMNMRRKFNNLMLHNIMGIEFVAKHSQISNEWTFSHLSLIIIIIIIILINASKISHLDTNHQ